MQIAAFFLALLLALPAPAPAAGTKADLKKMMAQLDKRWDKDLYEKVITLGAALKMPIPEEARKALIAGESLFKQATGLKGAYEAANSFSDAARLAPWWGDAYWDAALARQLAGQPGWAKIALQRYLLTKPSAADRRQAQDKIDSIDADIQAVTSNQGPELIGFWQQNGHQQDGQWIADSTDNPITRVYYFQHSGSCYDVMCVHCVSESTGLDSCAPGRIAFHETYYHDGMEDEVANNDCSYANGVMTCIQTFKGRSTTFRLIKRNACETVGGPGESGNFVLCK